MTTDCLLIYVFLPVHACSALKWKSKQKQFCDHVSQIIVNPGKSSEIQYHGLHIVSANLFWFLHWKKRWVHACNQVPALKGICNLSFFKVPTLKIQGGDWSGKCCPYISGSVVAQYWKYYSIFSSKPKLSVIFCMYHGKVL